MSSLLTYDVEELHVIGTQEPEDVPSEPGQLVSHVDFKDMTFGTVVACDDHHATVLWSKEPPASSFPPMSGGYVFAPYVPLIVSPTIFAPSGSAFAPRKGIVTRYAKKAVQSAYYGVVSVLGLSSGSV